MMIPDPDSEHRFKLETSDSGFKVLTVFYHGTDWNGAIQRGLAAYNMTADQKIQIIARPMPAEAK